MMQNLLAIFLSFFFINSKRLPKTRLGFIIQPMVAILAFVLVYFALGTLFPSCKEMLTTKNEFLDISENKKALKIEIDMKKAGCPY